MAVTAGTIETYDNSVLREDLREQYSMISPEEVPFQTAIGTSTAATQPKHEWSVVDLDDVDRANRVVEGEANPSVDEGTLAKRRSNYTQISDKRVVTSHTSEASDAAAEDIQRIAKQVTLKMRGLKRDKEGMLLTNWQAVGGSSGNQRVSAGLPAFIRTNTRAGNNGSDPTLSEGEEGYPNTAAGIGTGRSFSEDDFNDTITDCWNSGGDVTIAMMNSNNKRIVSSTFTGSSTRYKDSIDKTLVAAIDVYDSDFGQLSIVPNRFQPTTNADASAPGDEGGANTHYYVALLDPEFASVSYLDNVQQKSLAETGHSRDRLIWCEYTLVIDNEAAHGIIRDLDGTGVEPT